MNQSKISSRYIPLQEKIKTDFSKASFAYQTSSEVQAHNYLTLFNLYRNWLSPMDSTQLALDIGVGSGFGFVNLSRFMQHHGIQPHWVVTDLSMSMLRVQPAICDKVQLTMDQMPFTSESFSLVVSNFVLHWSFDLEVVMNEIVRLLKPAGVALLSFPIQGSFRTLEEVWLKNGLQSPLVKFPSRDDVRRVLSDTGLKTQWQTRPLSIPSSTGQDCIHWLKSTGVRSKVTVNQCSKSVYQCLMKDLGFALQTHGLKFVMMDIVIRKNQVLI